MNQDANILVVDDDERMCRLLDSYLGSAGYKVETAHNGAEMYQSMQRHKPDLIVLDLKMPGTHGLALAQELRKDANLGIIILTGSSMSADKIVGLELGADDYIEKPFDERELLARIRTVLRRVKTTDNSPTVDSSIARFSGWTLDLATHQLWTQSSEEISLTSHEYQLLEVLLHNANNVLTRDQIMEKISGDNWISLDRSVDVLIGKLRKKIEDDTRHPILIKTIRGIGYIMTSRVEFT